MNTSINASSPGDLIITGLGMMTSNGVGSELNLNAFDEPTAKASLEDYRVKNFNPAPYLTDRKVVKAVSSRDVLGLVAFEDCVKKAGVHQNPKMDPERMGLYVGAPPSATTDNANYQEAVSASKTASGILMEAEFGRNFRSANPTTLLQGLPNNVLCYGSKTVDARGPNSNYTALETSAHLAIIGAARAMKLGRIDCAIAGGFSAHTDPVVLENLKRQGVLKDPSVNPSEYGISPFEKNRSVSSGTITADGSAFVTMERRSTLERRGGQGFATLLATGMAADARWPLSNQQLVGVHQGCETLSELICDTLEKAGVAPQNVQMVSLAGSGIDWLDEVEMTAIQKVFGTHQESLPRLMCTSRVWGNLMEAGGIADIGLMARCFARGAIPESAVIETDRPQRSIPKDREQPHIGIVLRASTSGEYTCLVLHYYGDV